MPVPNCGHFYVDTDEGGFMSDRRFSRFGPDPDQPQDLIRAVGGWCTGYCRR